MLVLTRKKNESIYIGNDIKITVTRINGGQVRLAIKAPSDMRVRRGELPLITAGDSVVTPTCLLPPGKD